MTELESQLQASLDKLRKPKSLRCEAICRVNVPEHNGRPRRSEPLTYAEEMK